MVALIGKKQGMTQIFDETGGLIPVTVLEVTQNWVVGRCTEEKNGYNSVLLGYGDRRAKRLSKAELGRLPEGVTPCAVLKEVRDFEVDCELGGRVGLEAFEKVRFVDVQAVSKGKGFQGGMKRHGFGGGPKTHGSKFHRGLGSTGQAAYPSRVFKGTKMAGRMGGEQVTTMNLKIVRIDLEKNMLIVRGAVPGPSGACVLVRRAKKKS